MADDVAQEASTAATGAEDRGLPVLDPPKFVYRHFLRWFGGSARTKNVLPPGQDPATGRGRVYAMPAPLRAPAEFIRLCPWEMEYLFTVARHARQGIVEIGRYNGGSVLVLTCAAPEVPIYSIDLTPQSDARLKKMLTRNGIGRNVELITGDSQRTRYPQIGRFDLLFIDGDHSYEGCLADLRNWYELLSEDGHLLLHDAYLDGEGVQEAIHDFLTGHPELQIVQSPYIGARYWEYPAGSMAHFIKRGTPQR